MSGDINVQTFSGKVNISNNLKVGSGHLFVDTLNNQVGLNTNDPQANLHVNGNTYVHTNFRVGSGIIMNETSGRITAGSFVGDGSALQGINSDSGSWVNGVSSNVHLATIGDSVGIGVVDPQYKLDVDGDINITSGSTLRVGGTPAVFSNWTVNGSDIYRSSGNVGIGTTIPEAQLHIGPKDNDHIYLASSNNDYGWKIDTDDQGAGDVPFRIIKRTNDVDTTILTIKNQDGNVGIGTTSPGSALEVFSTTGTQMTLRSDSRYSTIFAVDDTGSSFFGNDRGAIRFTTGGDTSGSGASEKMRVLANGNVGIGRADPVEKLHVAGNIGLNWNNAARFIMNYDNSYRQGFHMDASSRILKIFSTTQDSGGAIAFQTRGVVGSSDTDYGTERMRIDKDGNVGIGVVPLSTLHIQGSNTAGGRVNIHQNTDGTGMFTGIHDANSDGGRGQLVLSSAYTDLVLASSRANDVHGTTLTFATYNPANTADYRKFVINQGNWGARAQFLDFGVSNGLTIPNPHSAINDTDTVLTMDGTNKRVGIGTRTPGYKLHVYDSGAASGWQNFYVRPTSLWGDGLTTASETAGTKYMTMNMVMLQGPHITPSSTGQDAYIRYGRAGGIQSGNWWETACVTDGSFRIRREANDAYGMTINSSGNVGIGTTSPSAKLHVDAGTAVATRITGATQWTNRPFACMGKSTGRVNASGTSTGNVFICNFTGINSGIANTSNGRFTAPTGFSGYYLVTYTGLGGANETAPNTRWLINGVVQRFGAAHVNNSPCSSRWGLSAQAIFYLNAGDYLTHNVIGGSLYGSDPEHSTHIVMFLHA